MTMTLNEIRDAIEALPMYGFYTKADLTEEDKDDLRRADVELQEIHDALEEHIESHTLLASP